MKKDKSLKKAAVQANPLVIEFIEAAATGDAKAVKKIAKSGKIEVDDGESVSCVCVSFLWKSSFPHEKRGDGSLVDLLTPKTENQNNENGMSEKGVHARRAARKGESVLRARRLLGMRGCVTLPLKRRVLFALSFSSIGCEL